MKPKEKQIRLWIGGMTCVHCQSRIEKALRRTDGIVRASVSFSTGAADITYDARKLSTGDIKGIITGLGYQPFLEPGGIRPDFGRVTMTLLLILLLYALLEGLGILNYLVPGALADSGMGYGMLFLTGLATSVHCIAMCGGINLSQCIPVRKAAGRSYRRYAIIWAGSSPTPQSAFCWDRWDFSLAAERLECPPCFRELRSCWQDRLW